MKQHKALRSMDIQYYEPLGKKKLGSCSTQILTFSICIALIKNSGPSLYGFLGLLMSLHL